MMKTGENHIRNGYHTRSTRKFNSMLARFATVSKKRHDASNAMIRNQQAAI